MKLKQSRAALQTFCLDDRLLCTNDGKSGVQIRPQDTRPSPGHMPGEQKGQEYEKDSSKQIHTPHSRGPATHCCTQTGPPSATSGQDTRGGARDAGCGYLFPGLSPPGCFPSSLLCSRLLFSTCSSLHACF